MTDLILLPIVLLAIAIFWPLALVMLGYGLMAVPIYAVVRRRKGPSAGTVARAVCRQATSVASFPMRLLDRTRS